MQADDGFASDPELVARLVAAQHPELGGTVTRLAEGWDNAIYRLGADHLVRMPRRHVAVELLRTEQRWLPELAPRLPVAIPAPTALGMPSEHFPHPWSVVPWLPGHELADLPAADRDALAPQLAVILTALHVPAPAEAPLNRFRGGLLAERQAAWADYRARADLAEAGEAVDRALAEGLAAESWTGPGVWLHGDLHPGNVLVEGARLSALIDFGDLTSGDPATDLAIGWLGFGPSGREALLDGVDAATRARAKAWAAGLTLAFLALAPDDERMTSVARHTLAQLTPG